jgi:8-oxo-dGTP diphosphatase
MPKSDQGVANERYHVIPRTLVFITSGSNVLLIKGAATKRLWANLYNGLGGHVERGEDALSAARREVQEEAGILVESMNLVGTILVDASEQTGICIFVFKGGHPGGQIVPSPEGALEWIPVDRLEGIPLVEDLKVILPKVIAWTPGMQPFSARSFYNLDDQLCVEFGG